MLKQVQWVGSSKADLRRFPDAVQDRMGFAIYQAQTGQRHRDAKPLKGFGADVLQVPVRHGGDAYRAVYTVRFASAVYILHVFPKKAKRGVTTPKPELDLIGHRLRAAGQHHNEHGGG